MTRLEIINMKKSIIKTMLFFIATVLLVSCDKQPDIDHQFTIAVIPDTQNMVDFMHQKQEGFPIDAAELFIEQMQFVADNTKSNGGEIEFVTSVGDVWQHLGIYLDDEHAARGFPAILFNPRLGIEKINKGINEFELPMARRGYNLLAYTGVPFGVAPGNHDYDTGYQYNPFTNDPDPRARIREANMVPNRHVGGYNTFNDVFGPDSRYFKGKDWYIDSFNGGVNSAQIFEAGGYKFLHFSFEMQAGDDVLSWAQNIIDAHPGIPTMMSTHDFLNPRGERMPSPVYDLALVDPLDHNSAEDIWNEWIKKNDQIFMILSGHQIGQAMRTDINDYGNNVFQILSDYQGRGMAANPPLDGSRITGLGDGWLRLMEFDTGLDVPIIKVRTYSTHYQRYANEFGDYAAWYRNLEQPNMSDKEFIEADHFEIELNDFKKRFGEPN